METGVNVISFTCSVPKILWIVDIVNDVVGNLPYDLFDEIRPWVSIFTQYAFIDKFTMEKAAAAITEVGRKRTVFKEPLFPINSRDSYTSLINYINRKPFRTMIIADNINSSFGELNKLLALNFKTFTVSPEQLVRQEIKKGTKIGKWLKNVLKIRKGIPICIVLKLLEIELDKEKYSTEGFILTGFPIFPRVKTANDENLAHKDVDNTDLKSDYLFSNQIDDESFKNCIQRQLDFIYSLGGRPDYIIYISANSYSEQFTEAIGLFQKFMILFFRENVLRIYSRLGTYGMLEAVINRLKFVNLKVNYDCHVMNESKNDALSLDELCNTEKILPQYKWWVSRFGHICPVDLYRGRLRLCDSKFPVRYLKYIFLCSSEGNRKLFKENPKKYIPIKPKCRVAVIGPHKTGKTMLSKYLARFFKAEVYKAHTQNSEKITKISNLTSEIDDLTSQVIRENQNYKEKKILEWTFCVLNVLNDIVAETLKGNSKKINYPLFTSLNAIEYFEDFQESEISNDWIENFLLDYVIFETSLKNITANDFLSWINIKSDSETKYLFKQYVIDGAPLDLNFWRDLLTRDQLPDCVFFLGLSSLNKMFDIYSCKHDAFCVNDKFITENLSSQFVDLQIFTSANNSLRNIKQNPNRNFDQTYESSLIKDRIMSTTDFLEGYNELQAFLESNNVKCIEVDISNQTWTKSILYALTEYLSIYQTKASAKHYYVDQNSEESNSSSSDLSHEITVESECSIKENYTFYGSCFHWCPVSLKNLNILKKGNSMYAAEYENKTYNMHSKENLKEFILNTDLYIKIKWTVPPPRIYLLGLNHKNKSNFAENLSSSLNVQIFSHKQNITSVIFKSTIENFTIKLFSESYNQTKKQFLNDLKVEYSKGIVLHGFPFLYEQFNDLIRNDLYPESVLIFSDHEEIHQFIFRCMGRLHLLTSYGDGHQKQGLRNFRLNSISAYVESLSENEKQIIEEKCVNIMQSLEFEIRMIEEECLKLGIGVLKIPSKYHLSKQIQISLNYINHGRNRVALFETVKEITMDESTILLNSGYCRFSRFKYSCPVDVSRLITINQFDGLRMQGKVFPCIYLEYIYFICGKKNLKEFKRDPIEFAKTCNPPQLCDPLKIAVLGTSNSIVSNMCRTISSEFGLKLMTLGDFNHKIDIHTDETMLLDMLRMETNSTTNGFILDNIPLTPKFILNAALNCMDFSAVFIIDSSFDKVLENLTNENEDLESCSRLSLTDVKKDFCERKNIINQIRNSIDLSMFNVHYIYGYGNSWALLDRIKLEIIKTSRCITSYKLQLIKSRCANLNYLNIFFDKAVIRRQINHFYCQACLALGKLKAFKYLYVNVGPEFYSEKCQDLLNQPYGYTKKEIYKTYKFSNPFGSTQEEIEPLTTQSKHVMCMFQYNDVFCWVCEDHTINFMLNTEQYYKNLEKLKPLYVPFLVIGYTKEFVAYQGFCPVEYKKGQLERGAINLSVYYRRKVYLMANIPNTIEFLTCPDKYRNLNFNITSQIQKKDILKNIREDVISNIIYEVASLRPKHFALDATLSALTCVALKLKCLNTDAEHVTHWNSITRQFSKDCKKLNQEINKYSNVHF